MVIHEPERRAPAVAEDQGVQTLTIADVARLPLAWHHRHDRAEIRQLIRGFPGRSVWIPATGEFALIGPWRNRTDIVQVLELSAQRSAATLMEAASAASGYLGADLLVIMENDERRRPSYYRAIEFQHLEDVITMDLDLSDRPAPVASALRFVRVRPDSSEFTAIARIDELAFPWIWRNVPAEFESYIRIPDVEIHLGLLGGEPVSYFGVTLYRDWGHLDRIAVVPGRQGQGIGHQTLIAATDLMALDGAESVGLSTQGHNYRSRRMYERFGFARRDGNDYRIYGRPLRDESLAALLDRSPDDRSPDIHSNAPIDDEDLRR